MTGMVVMMTRMIMVIVHDGTDWTGLLLVFI